ncbi:MAG: phosphopyruvate hydratase [Alphaproteobacteria bacterium]
MSGRAITKIIGRRVWDSRGRPTVEAEVHVDGGALGRAIAPAGASRGSHEAVDLRDGGERFGGLDVSRAVTGVNGEICSALNGMAVDDQAGIDQALIALDGAPNKARLGGNATVAVSLACLHAAAAAADQPLWAYLAGGTHVRLPVPEIQIFGGGAHAARRVDLQDFMVMCPSAASFAEAIERTAEVYRHAGLLMGEAGLLSGTADEGGWWPNFDGNEAALDMLVRAIEAAGLIPGDDVFISLDIAASEFHEDGIYRLGLDDQALDRDGMVELLLRWVDHYPILSIEDPLAEDDVEGTAAFTRAVADRVQVVGDDLLVTNPARVAPAVADNWCNAALIKVNQVGTVSEAREACRLAQDAEWGTLVSARSGDTEDLSIAHLSIGWDAGQLKVGSFARSERMAKWNEVLRIEEAMGDKARYAGWSALPRSVQEGR